MTTNNTDTELQSWNTKKSTLNVLVCLWFWLVFVNFWRRLNQNSVVKDSQSIKHPHTQSLTITVASGGFFLPAFPNWSLSFRVKSSQSWICRCVSGLGIFLCWWSLNSTNKRFWRDMEDLQSFSLALSVCRVCRSPSNRRALKLLQLSCSQVSKLSLPLLLPPSLLCSSSPSSINNCLWLLWWIMNKLPSIGDSILLSWALETKVEMKGWSFCTRFGWACPRRC